MDFRNTSSRLAAASSMNGIPILPVSNERHSSSSVSRPGSLNMSGIVNGNSGISMPLSLPIPLIGQQQQQQQPHKRPRVEGSAVAPPPGITYPYRLDVDLSAFPPTAHATALQSQQSPHQQRSSQGSLGSLPFPHNSIGINMGMQNDGFSSQTPFEFPSSRRSMSYASGQGGGGGAGSFGNSGSVSGMFGPRPGPQTTNMLMDLLNSTAASDVSSFEWPGSPQGGQLDGTCSFCNPRIDGRTHVPC